MKKHFLLPNNNQTTFTSWLAAILLGWSQLAAQPVLIKDIYPGPTGSEPAAFINFKNTLFFTADDGTHGRELWKSNGTAAGTVLVKDIKPGLSPGTPFFLRAAADKLFFITQEDGNDTYLQFLYNYWSSDGTEAGTAKVEEFWGYALTVYNNDLYFIGSAPWPDGTSLRKVSAAGGISGIQQLRTDNAPGYGGVYSLREHNGFLYAASGELTETCCIHYKLWKSNGTTAGTAAIDLTTHHRNSVMMSSGFNGQYFYFTISDFFSDPQYPYYHYRTDLTTGETELLDQTGDSPSEADSKAAEAGMTTVGAAALDNESVTINGTRFYAASDATHGRELWKETVAAQTTFRLNAGGASYSSAGGKVFAADAFFTGGKPSTAVSGGVANTTDDVLYRVGRYGESFSYNLPTGKGSFDVVLHFNETYWGNGRSGGAGSRKFNVDIEGQRKLTEYDIFAKSGGAMRAIKENFRVTVTDGTLNLLFSKGSADLAYIAALEVTPASGPAVSFYRAINLNGDAINLDGYFWAGKTTSNYTTNGGGFVNTTTALIPSIDATRASMIRSSIWRYTGLQLNLTAVPAGTYQVYLHVWEDNNPQTFSVTLEGKVVQSNYNSGPAGTWKKLGPYQATITDGTISLATTGGAANFSGIEVWNVTDAPAPARIAIVMASNEGTPEHGQVTVYPNPVQNELTVQLPFSAETVKSTTVTDALGKVSLLNAHTPAGEDRLLIRIGTLQKGFYLLTLDTGLESHLVKFIKQ